MFKFVIDNFNATIAVTLTAGNPGPRTTMYYPRDGVVEIDGDVFTINGKLYTPMLEDSKIGKSDVIRIKHD